MDQESNLGNIGNNGKELMNDQLNHKHLLKTKL